MNTRGSDGQPLLDLGDIYDLNEIIAVEAENQKRAQAAAERKAQEKKRG